jgi:acetylglutamate kinase/acetylglutamate/LysW-gamma-L-alpha-aminoadipate kinase
MNRQVVTVKLGGSCLEDMPVDWWDDLAAEARTRPVLLAHGWSKQLKQLRLSCGKESTMLRDRYGNQSRWTTPDVIGDIKQVSDEIAERVRRQLEHRGVGMEHIIGSDGLLQAGPAERWWWWDKQLIELDNLVGPVIGVDATRLPALRPGMACLVTPLARNEAGQEVNTDADRAAAAIAAALLSPDLALVTDVPNLLIDGEPVRQISVEAAGDFRDHGATGGMRKKLRAACEAVERGVNRVIIGNAPASDLLSGRSGTVITV